MEKPTGNMKVYHDLMMLKTLLKIYIRKQPNKKAVRKFKEALKHEKKLMQFWEDGLKLLRQENNL
ncbi:hypothetical protein [Parasutterella excrementihominis]|uniref:hypothetical protein n=1 Tax=Parasutterella excrementihominis TaxID=487175 RepID=UPI00351F8885